jgi:5'-3' exonuclease
MSNLVIIDANALGHAYHHSTRLSVGSIETQAIFGVLKAVQGIAAERVSDAIVVLWDGKAKHRFDAFPEYKANRVATDPKQQAVKDAYHKQVPIIRKGLELLGVKQIIHPTEEADDLAGLIVRQMSHRRKILLVTGDGDWKQLVSDSVTWLDPRGEGRKVTPENFAADTGYLTPREFMIGKALTGDPSDGIPGVGGIGEKGAPLFLAQFKTVEEFWRQCDSGEFKATKKAHLSLAFGEGRENYLRNIRLVNLLDPRPIDYSQAVITHQPLNEAGFKTLCERLAFASFLRSWDDYMRPFRGRDEVRRFALEASE